MRILALFALGWLVAGCAVLPSSGPAGSSGLPAAAADMPVAGAGEPVQAAAPEDAARLTLNNIAIERLSDLPQETAVSDADLMAVADAYIGQPVTLEDLRTLATEMEGAFRAAGYPYVRVVLPPQEVEGGRVRFQVIEGHVRGVVVLGDNPVAKRQVEARLSPIDGQGPVPVSRIERAIGLLSDVPGLKSRVSLARGTEGPGSMRVVADAAREEGRVLLNMHNWGSEALGREGATLLVRQPGWSTYGDEIQFSAFSTLDVGEQYVAFGAYERTLTTNGLKARVEATYGEAEPGGAVQTLGATSKSVTGEVSVTYPLVIDRTTRIDVGGGLDFANLKGELFEGTVLLSEDKTRAGFLAFDAETEWFDWKISGGAEVRKGLDFFDGSKRGDTNLARTDAHPNATIFKGDIALSSPDYAGFALDVRAMGQFSRDPLMAVEEFSFGNYTIVRGYDPGAAAGDTAVAVSAELAGPTLDLWNKQLHVRPVGFFDVGEYWNRDATAVANRTVASTGGGLRLSIDNYARAELLYTKPLRAPRGEGESIPGERVMFSVTTSLSKAWDDLSGLATRFFGGGE